MYITSWYDWGFPAYPYPDSVRNMFNENLGVINYPDSIGKACNFQPFSFNLGGKRVYAGLPNNPNYSLGRLVGSPCDTLQWVGTPETPNPQGALRTCASIPIHLASKINIELSDFKNASYVLKIVDAMGKEIWQQEIVKQKTEIDLEKIKQGIYFVMLSGGNDIFTGKIIKM
ncbi:MAG: T9SS type A sorting domain-containing protein [Bacteroidetes bacterium]|nr:T9SS type A sorting domain-containing protein [Bacteroidota bacterium]